MEPCAAIRQDPQKIIANYSHDFGLPQNGGPALNSGSSTLRCGTTGWGYVHIKKDHQSHRQSLANLSYNQGWMDTTSIPEVLGFLVQDLEAAGNVLHSSDRELQRLLDR